MNKNVIQFIVDENGDYKNIPVGRVKATSNLTTRIQLVTPITASVAVNYVIYDSKNIEKKQYLIPTGDLGSAVVDPNSPNYQEVAGWKVYEADIYAPILSVISRYRTGKVGMSFEFVEQVPNALCKNFIGYFGRTKELPETAEVGEYYICEDYNFWLNGKLYNKGDILVWYGDKWNNGGIFPKGLTGTEDISVDPAISYPTEEVDETAFGNAIGEIGDDVAELDTRLKGVETDLNRKQDEADELIETDAKTVVGAINELNSEVNILDGQVATLQEDYAATHNKAEQALNKSVEANSKSDEAVNTAGIAKDIAEGIDDKATNALNTSATALNTANEAHTIAIGASRAIVLNDETELLAYISDQTNKGKHNVGDAIYLKQIDVQDYWITEVLDIPNASGHYYEIEPLESKLPDITNMVTTDTEQTITEIKNFTGGLKQNGVDVAVATDITTTQQSIDNLQNEVDTKQDELVSGVNIKTINDTSLLGSGDITISLNGIDYLKDPDKTYLVIKTPADNDTFVLRTGEDGSPNYTIEWGDGASENIIGTANPSHVYETAGMYLITISGNFSNGVEHGFSGNNKIIEVYGGSNYPLVIGSDAFRNCTSLKTAHFPNVTSMAARAFEYCTSLTTANFPKAMSIGTQAFNTCSSLTTANFPNATSIGNYAFFDCTSLKELTLVHVTTNEAGVRFQNVKLINLTIAQDVTSYDINRITTFFKANGGTFIGNETKHGLRVEKTPTADNDVVRKVDLDAINADNINYDEESSVKEKLDNLEADKADKSTTLTGYGITDAYTKTEIESKIASVYKYKGSVANYASLPTDNLTIGDVYNSEDTGDNYAWTGSEWDKLAGTVDLTNYYTKGQTDTKLDNKVDKVAGKQLSTEDYTSTEKSKLANIEAGAQANTITSVAGRTGAVTIAKTDVGLGNVDNTSDQNKPISNATQAALNTKQNKLQTVADEATAEAQSLANPDNFYFYEEE